MLQGSSIQQKHIIFFPLLPIHILIVNDPTCRYTLHSCYICHWMSSKSFSIKISYILYVTPLVSSTSSRLVFSLFDIYSDPFPSFNNFYCARGTTNWPMPSGRWRSYDVPLIYIVFLMTLIFTLFCNILI
jgi:hypothetical protein